MPVPRQIAEVVLRGLDQKTSARMTAPGRLERARNVAFDKAGQLDKRNGYLLLENTQANAEPMPAHWARLVLERDELLALTVCEAFAIVDPAESLQSLTRAAVHRGLVGSGSVSAFTVVVGTDTEES